jgi:DHA1 family multidrug resistance protein-like MFS transporter
MASGKNSLITKEVALLCIAIFLADASHSIVIPIFPNYAQKIGASLSILGSYGSVSAIAMLLLSIPFGRLSDRYGRKKMILPGLFLFIIVPLSYIIAKSPVHLYPIRLLLGIGMGLIFGNGFLLMTEKTKPENRNIAQGLYMTSMGLGFTLGPLLGGLTAKLYGTELSFIVSSGFAVLSIIIFYFVDEKQSKYNEIEIIQSDSVFKIIKDPQILAAGTANYLNSLMFNAVTLFFPVYGSSIGFDEAEIGVGFTTRGLASTAVRLPVGSISKHVRPLFLMVIGLMLSAVMIFSVSQSTGLILISMLMGAQGIAYGIYLTSGNVYVASNSNEQQRGTAMAMYSMFGNLSGIINPLILGLIAEAFGSRGALQFSTTTTIFGVVLIYLLASSARGSGMISLE